MRLSILRDVVHAMRFLHDVKPRPVLHGDLKAASVFVDLKMRAKVIGRVDDFSGSDTGAGSGGGAAWSPFWAAPEVLEGAADSKASDGACMSVPWFLARVDFPA